MFNERNHDTAQRIWRRIPARQADIRRQSSSLRYGLHGQGIQRYCGNTYRTDSGDANYSETSSTYERRGQDRLTQAYLPMPNHWTYEDFHPDRDLLQGDILEPTEDLRSVFRCVHPHFLDPKYTAFLLITQSCDLAVRKGKCNTRYLNIAVIRPIEAVLHDLLGHVCQPVVDGIYLQETKGEARRLLGRLFNQNEQALGLFYLHPDLKAGIAIPSVSLLRVTVTLRVDHYDIVRNARRGRLCPEFRSKLGWLVGNLYSRVGTQDWHEPSKRSKELEQLVSQYLDSEDIPHCPLWVPKALVQAAKGHGVSLEQLDRDRVASVLEKHRPPPAKSRVIEQTLRVLRNVIPSIDDATLVRIKNRLGNDQLFSKAIQSVKHE